VVGVLFSEEAHRKPSRSIETSRSALSVVHRRRSRNIDKKKYGTSKSKWREGYPSQEVWDVDNVVRWGKFRKTTSERMEKVKARRRIPYISQRVINPIP